MKKILSFCLAVLCILSFCLSALADTEVTKDGMTVHLADIFTVFTAENLESKSVRAAELSEDTETLRKKLESDYLFYAVAENLGWTVFMTSSVTDVSSEIVNLAEFSDGALAESALIGGVKDRAADIKEIRNDAALFYRLTFEKDEQKGNADSRVMYISVINGRIYTLTLIEDASSLSTNAADTADYIFSNLEYTVETERQRVAEKKRSFATWAIVVCIPLAAVGGFFIVRSMKRDFEAAKREENLKKNMRKKPRR